ncbi:kinesin-like protein KIF15 [Diadema antillarum]|uniref:kinesin-like protein KIF15 n=1 Tax=Diadema antillarum TaxID=105358 RepID=UPI003A87E537
MSKKDKSQGSNGSEGDSIQVYVRVRPSEAVDSDLDFGQCLEVRRPDTIIMHCKPEPKVFTYDHVTDGNTTQESVFTAVGKSIIESCVAGYNGTIFAYGQTGSGKTFTMLGPSEDGDNFHHELRGVIPRSFEYLFSLVNREREKHGDRFEFLCRCSFLEIYNEQIFDLLDPACMGLHLRENMKKGVFVDGLIERVVSSPSEAYDVLTCGWVNRRVAATSMNRESSRSHAVFTVSIESKEKKAGVSNIRVSQLHLVDLAGSERQKDTKAVGMRLKEAGSINRSLSVLGNVIMALVDIAHKKQRHVPYRDSKLSFLLRDALGGNAKTYIIANVHPDAKCFGETLSTLKFARRAKMIKNRAVVNEDTMGNVMHLQAEIRRLREALAQANSARSVPRGPGEGGDSQGSSTIGGSDVGLQQPANNGGKWKKYFLEAMCLRDGVETEKKELHEKISKLEELCSKRERAIQSTKMIVKFRDSTVALLEKNKGKATPQDDRDKINENLKKEVSQLREQLDHNPIIMRYAMENQSLRGQLKKMQALESVRAGREITASKAQDLEKLFMELRESLPKGGEIIVTPNSTPVDGDNIPTSTVVILKSQIKKLQLELENAKQEHAETEEMSRKKRLELESELESYKKSNTELEKTLEGVKVKNRLERDALNDMHIQTIKKITTPKKVSYNLRSRLIMRVGATPGASPGAGDGSSPVMDEDIGGGPSLSSPALDQEGIVDEDMPEHLVEQCNEALTTELQKLQEKSSVVEKQLQEQDALKLKLQQNISKLEHQLAQTNELHESESQKWSETEEEMSSKLAELTRQVTTLQHDYSLARGEAEDFRVLLAAADKELGQEKRQKGEENSAWNKAKAALDAQVVRLENELSTRLRELENGTEEKQQLQDAYNTLQAEFEFQQQREFELESRLRSRKEEIQTLQTEIQSHLEKIDVECEKNMRLTAELRQGDNTKQELLASQELIDQLREERKELYQRLDDESKKLADTSDALDAANSAMLAMKRTEAEQKEALASLLQSLQDQKGMVKEREEDLAELGMRLEDSSSHVTQLEAAVEQGKASLEALRGEVSALEERLQSQASSHQEQIEKMREEAMDMSSQQKELLRELEKQSQEVTQLHQQVKEKEEELQAKESEHKTTVAKLESQLEEVQNNLSTVIVELGEPETKRRRMSENQTQELESLRESQTRFNELFKEFESMREEKNKEIHSLKVRMEELEETRIAKEILAAQHQTLKYEMEAQINELKEKELSLSDEMDSLRRDLEHHKRSLTRAVQDKEVAVEKLQTLQTEYDQVKANQEILQESLDQLMEELERTSALESAHFKEKQDLRSQLEGEHEEKSKLSKEVSRLKEKNEEMSLENAKLVGHQNSKQKIHYHMQVKNQNMELSKQLSKALSDNAQVRRDFEAVQKRLVQLEASSNGNKSQLPRKPVTLKENSQPSSSGPS